MTTESLKQLWRTQPFQPFTIYLADGRKFTVKHPEFIALSPGGRTAIIYQQGESFNIIDLPLVTDLEVRSDGSVRRRKSRK